jgi:hypothetical protein
MADTRSLRNTYNRPAVRETVTDYVEPREAPDHRGRLRLSLWQCLCLTWNRRSADWCTKCGRAR